MWISKKKYEEIDKKISKLQDSVKSSAKEITILFNDQRNTEYSIKKIEFLMDNNNKYSVGDIIGNWKVNRIFAENLPIVSLVYPFDRRLILKYNCINCADNKVGTFTESELDNLK